MLEDAEESAARRLQHREVLYGIIHRTGCEGMYAFCQACIHCLRGNDLQSHRTLQLTDEDLCLRLREEIELTEAI